jgi:hypothetical protein
MLGNIVVWNGPLKVEDKRASENGMLSLRIYSVCPILSE